MSTSGFPGSPSTHNMAPASQPLAQVFGGSVRASQTMSPSAWSMRF